MNLSKVKKGIIFMVALLTVSTSPQYAQNTDTGLCARVGGIYLNSQDYREGKLSYSFDCKSPGRIKLNDLFGSKYAYVIINGKKTKFNKDSIYGYQNCKNETYRFYKKHDEEFRILESKNIVIYSSYIDVSSNNGKTNQIEPAYFFSKTIDSEILPLIVVNLKKAFPDNIKFHDMLDTEFGGGESLSAYSPIDNMYKINLLLNKSNLK